MTKAEPPADQEAEKKLVGALVAQPSLVDDLMARLRPEDFYYPNYAALYAGAIDLVVLGQPLSAATLARQAKVGQAEVVACLEGADPEEAEFWAARIIKTRKLRALLLVGEAAVLAATSDPADADAAALRIEGMLAAEGEAVAEATDMPTAAALVRARISRYIHEPDAIVGLETGWTYLDRVLDGIQRGTVTSVYAKTGQFKSMFCQNIMWRLGRQGIPGAAFTTEMTVAQVTERLVQLEAGLNFRELRYQREMFRYEKQIMEAAADIENYPIWINDRSLLDIGFIKGFLARLKRSQGIAYAVVDLVDHVVSTRYKDSETKNEQFVAQQLKQIAKELDIGIIQTTHVAKPDRKAIAHAWIDPDEMKGSSSKSQDADAAISLVLVKHGEMGGWEAMTRDERMGALRTGEPLYLMAAITKNRSGEMADIPFIVNINEGARMMPSLDGRYGS